MNPPSFIHAITHPVHRLVSILTTHKKLIAASILATIVVVGFGTYAINLRSKWITEMNAKKSTQSTSIFDTTKSNATQSAIPLPTSTASAVLGDTSDADTAYDSTDYTNYVVPTSFPIPTAFPTFAPYPTTAPVTVSTPQNCAGTATESNSQVYLSSKSVQVGGIVTITVELRDCNNNLASNDALKISLQNSDSTAKINGQSSSVTINAENGKASFTVTSQTAGTDTFLITDTNQNFTVTMPGYHNPSIIFTSNASGNSNCTTAAGIPNAWYSNIYPNPPLSTNTGSIQMQVVIRDCDKNTLSSDSIKISVNSGDTNTKINGGASPYTFTVQNGQGNFTLSSQITGTVVLLVQDVTNSFTVTDPNNHNPSITFTASTTTPAPTATPTPTSGPTPTTATDLPTPTTTPTISPTPTNP